MCIKQVELLDSFDTVLYADCVEWCPYLDNSDIFICATYQLENQEEQIKKGKIYLIKVINDKIKVIQTIDTDGILDVKWSPVNRSNTDIVCGAVLSTGFLVIYKLADDLLSEVSRVKICEGIGLSLSWGSDGNIGVSDSNGDITLVRIEDSRCDIITKWSAHSYEAWIVNFHHHYENLIFTGKEGKYLRL